MRPSKSPRQLAEMQRLRAHGILGNAMPTAQISNEVIIRAVLGAALQKWNFGRADDVDDERFASAAIRRTKPVWTSAGFAPGVEDIKHREEGRVIEDRADRPDEDHELEDIAMSICAGWRDIRRRHYPSGSPFAKIIEKIVGQHLNRQHRQEWQEDACAKHAEHVAEIRAGAHFDVFRYGCENLAPFDDASCNTIRLFSSRNDVGRFLGDVDGGVDRYADVGGFQRRAVVDAVAEKADDMAPGGEAADDAGLLRRRNLGEHRNDGASSASSASLIFSISGARTMRSTSSPTSAADLAGDDLIVAGDDL